MGLAADVIRRGAGRSALFIRFGVSESEVWQKAKAESFWQLAKTLVRHWRLWLYLTLLMMMLNCSSHGTQDIFPAFMKNFRKLDTARYTDVLIIMNIGAIIGGIVFGLASDRLGRRRMMIAAFLGALAVTPLWAFSPTLGWICAAGAFAMQFFVQGAWGIIPAQINEPSPDSVRGFSPRLLLSNAATSWPPTSPRCKLGSSPPATYSRASCRSAPRSSSPERSW